MNIAGMMDSGIQRIAKTAARFYGGDPSGRTFLGSLAVSLRQGARRRARQERSGVHIPPFLIASIAEDCNLACTGCYARAGGHGETIREPMTAMDWRRVFQEAVDLGVSFVFLAGGEPLLRRDVIDTATTFEELVFPLFTNGTLLDGEVLGLLDTHRNLIPVLSIEGDDACTDARRGGGVAGQVWKAAQELRDRGILYGVSITVTAENREAVTQKTFVASLRERGCGLVFYVEYVPAQKGTEGLVLSPEDLVALGEDVERLRADRDNQAMILLSFPGDEERMGGCLAAGRGFFHINAYGGAEPCPFSPFSALNVRDHSILEVLRSSFFQEVRTIGAAQSHNRQGGCTLFACQDTVRATIVEQTYSLENGGIPMNIYDFTVKDNQGGDLSLEQYRGKVLLVVNTATKCGLTPQYDALQALYDKYREQGLEILDFPCNQFLKQAPGTDEEIQQFCTLNYKTTFPRFAKIDVNGEQAHPLFQWLKEQLPEVKGDKDTAAFEKKVKLLTLKNAPGDIKWNFEKFLLTSEGAPSARYSPAYTPDRLEADIEALL